MSLKKIVINNIKTLVQYLKITNISSKHQKMCKKEV